MGRDPMAPDEILKSLAGMKVNVAEFELYFRNRLSALPTGPLLARMADGVIRSIELLEEEVRASSCDPTHR